MEPSDARGKASKMPVTPKELGTLARRAVDLMAEGNSPETALALAGASPAALQNRSLREQIKTLVGQEFFTAELQRASLRQVDFASYIKLVTKGLADFETSGDVAGLALAQKYSTMLRQDPEIGLTAPPQVVVNLDLKPVNKILEDPALPADVFEWPVEDSSSTKDK